MPAKKRSSSGSNETGNSSGPSYVMGVKVLKPMRTKRRCGSFLLKRTHSMRLPVRIPTPVSSRTDSDVIQEDRKFHEKNCMQKLIYILSFSHCPTYRFLYSSWEIIKAVRLGRTQSKVDFVAYRFVCPMIILTFHLFWLTKMRLRRPYVYLETWLSFVEMGYYTLFLGHVLMRNRQTVLHSPSLHIMLREYTRTMHHVPNGYSRVVEQKSPILNKEPIGKTEKVIWFLLNTSASIQLAVCIAHFASWLVHYRNERPILLVATDLNTAVSSIMILVEVICTGIFLVPPHILYPIIFINSYFLFTVYLYHRDWGHDKIYTQLDWNNPQQTLILILQANGLVLFCHLFLCLMIYVRERKIKEYSLVTKRKRRYKELLKSRLRAKTVYHDSKSLAPRFKRLGSFGTIYIEKWRLGKKPSDEIDSESGSGNEEVPQDIPDPKDSGTNRRRPLPFADVIAKHKNYGPSLDSLLLLYQRGKKPNSAMASTTSSLSSKTTSKKH